jgi:hypothetical protein
MPISTLAQEFKQAHSDRDNKKCDEISREIVSTQSRYGARFAYGHIGDRPTHDCFRRTWHQHRAAAARNHPGNRAH